MKLSKGALFALLALVTVAAALVVFDGNKSGQNDSRIGNEVVSVGDLATVTAIEISTGNDKVELKTSDAGLWSLASDGFPVDASQVKTLLESLEKLKIQRLASKDNKRWDKFEISEGKYITLKGSAFKNDWVMLLGKNRTGGGQYVSLDGKVYLVNNPINASGDADYWAWKTLLDIEAKEIKSMTIPSDKKSIELTRNKPEEELELKTQIKQKIKANELKGFQNAWKGLRFSKRVDPSNELAKTALSKSKPAKVELFNGAVFELKLGKIGQEKEEKFFLDVEVTKSSEAVKDQVELLKKMKSVSKFEIDSFTYSKFVKSMKDLTEKS